MFDEQKQDWEPMEAPSDWGHEDFLRDFAFSHVRPDGVCEVFTVSDVREDGDWYYPAFQLNGKPMGQASIVGYDVTFQHPLLDRKDVLMFRYKL